MSFYSMLQHQKAARKKDGKKGKRPLEGIFNSFSKNLIILENLQQKLDRKRKPKVCFATLYFRRNL
jgi:hypothetical protein